MKPRRRVSLEQLYARIPEVQCKGLCQDSCGPIAMSREEEERIRATGVVILPMADALAALDRGEDYYCPALVDGKCSVYAIRPTICRLWGATTSMPCPHGCSPGDSLSQEESFELLRLAARAGGGMAGGIAGGMASGMASGPNVDFDGLDKG